MGTTILIDKAGNRVEWRGQSGAHERDSSVEHLGVFSTVVAALASIAQHEHARGNRVLTGVGVEPLLVTGSAEIEIECAEDPLGTYYTITSHELKG